MFYTLYSGRLTAVVNPIVTFANFTFTLTWEAPYTQDIKNVDPDIEGYCVDVMSSSSLFHSECGIDATEFAVDSSLISGSVCHTVLFAITPVNIVGNGSKITLVAPAVETTGIHS